ncbi:hypothetical protein ACQPZP_43410 [Spirillospora sp. CA-142024]|uniref:hypothetical protein n=1 Tax=Spirillospora sp. CA-142024 TaxID=3240036 RepID=UPI003D8BA9D7
MKAGLRMVITAGVVTATTLAPAAATVTGASAAGKVTVKISKANVEYARVEVKNGTSKTLKDVEVDLCYDGGPCKKLNRWLDTIKPGDTVAYTGTCTRHKKIYGLVQYPRDHGEHSGTITC